MTGATHNANYGTSGLRGDGGLIFARQLVSVPFLILVFYVPYHVAGTPAEMDLKSTDWSDGFVNQLYYMQYTYTFDELEM